MGKAYFKAVQSMSDWLRWVSMLILSAIGSGAAVTVFAFTTFQTKHEAGAVSNYQEQMLHDLKDRSKRMEDKLDKLIGDILRE